MNFIPRLINEEYVGFVDPREQYTLAASESETWRVFVLRQEDERMVEAKYWEMVEEGCRTATVSFLRKTLAQELSCVMPSHMLFRRPGAAVPAGVSGTSASASARSVMVGDVLELVTEEAGGVAGSRALVTVHRVAEHGSMGPSAGYTWQRGETESMNVPARGVFCRGESAERGHVHLCTKGHSGYHVGGQDLHCLEWRVVPRKEKHQSWVGFDGEGPTSSVRRGDARDRREDVPNEVTAVDGREGPLLSPPINPLAVAAGELEESLLGRLPGGIEARLDEEAQRLAL